MSGEKQSCRLGPELTFLCPDERPLPAREVEVSLRVEEPGGITEFVVLFELDYEDYERVERGGCFHLSKDVRGPLFGGSFDATRRVRIEAHLATEHLPALVWGAAEVYGVAAALRGADIGSALRATESYFARHVTQQHPTLPVSMGYSTSWVD